MGISIAQIYRRRARLIDILAEGAIGGTAQKIGGPFDKDGAIGKQFTTGGSIGGSVQQTLGKDETNAFSKK